MTGQVGTSPFHLGVGRPPAAPRSARCAAAAAAALAPPLVAGPPAGWDHRQALKQASVELVRRRHPELLDLVDQGVLVAVPRAAAYSERRADGYREPEAVFVVGTAHVSARSAADVDRVVRAVRPDAVVVEVCRSRQGLLWAAGGGGSSVGGGTEADAGSDSDSAAAGVNPMSLAGESLPRAFLRSMELGGPAALALRLVLARLSEAATSASGGPAAGEDMRAAARAADAVGARLVLGDRPIEITLARAWAALPWRQRARLAVDLGRGARAGFDPAAVEALKDDDAVAAVTAALAGAYPALLPPLVHERDLYLAWSLKRSKAVDGAAAVVGVVGRGHLRGVCWALAADDAGRGLRFADLVGGANSRSARRAVRAEQAARFAAETALLAGLWWGWQHYSGGGAGLGGL